MPKIIKKLSEKEVRNAKPKDKAYKLCDEGGLRLLIRPSGTKVWQVPYIFHGKQNTYTIGQYCPNGREGFTTLADARKERDRIKALLDEGIEPNRDKAVNKYNSVEKMQTTFEATAREWHSKGGWVPKHSKNILSCLEKDVFPIIGHLQIAQVTTQDILHILTIIQDRGALDVAKRVCKRCEDIFDYAIIKGICINNPASGRSKFVQSRKPKNRPHLKGGLKV